MKQWLTSVFVASGLLLSATAVAGPVEFSKGNHVLPVLVTVDAQGSVEEINPPFNLRSSQMRLLREAVEHMVAGPAMDNGEAIHSRFLLMLRLDPSTANDSTYRFSYVSARPVWPGRMKWHRGVHGADVVYSLSPVIFPNGLPPVVMYDHYVPGPGDVNAVHGTAD